MNHAALSVLASTLLFAACATSPAARPTDLGELERRIAARLTGFRGDVGVYVRDLTTGRELAIRADELFPTASMIKVPIACALLGRVAAGELAYHEPLTYDVDRLYEGEDLLGSFQDGEKITLDKVMMLSLTMSDNTAALWCQELAGTGTEVNRWLADNGFEGTRVNSRTEGRRADWERYGWGQTTPREMVELFVRIRDRGVVSPAASEELHRCLGRIYWDGEALASIPPGVETMSKQGAVSQSRSETVLVHAPHGDYAFCLITNDQEDKSWDHDNEGYVLLRDVSRLCWEHFEPGLPYAPPAEETFR